MEPIVIVLAVLVLAETAGLVWLLRERRAALEREQRMVERERELRREIEILTHVINPSGVVTETEDEVVQ